jgi:hypothetical protein
MHETLEHARLGHSYEAELRTLLDVDLVVVDDVGLDAMDATSREPRHPRSPRRA